MFSELGKYFTKDDKIPLCTAQTDNAGITSTIVMYHCNSPSQERYNTVEQVKYWPRDSSNQNGKWAQI